MHRKIFYRALLRRNRVSKKTEIITPQTIMEFLEHYHDILMSFLVADNLNLKNITILEMIYDRLKDGSKKVNVSVFNATEKHLRQELLQKIKDITAKHQLYLSDEDENDGCVTIHSCRSELVSDSLAASNRPHLEGYTHNNQNFSQLLSPRRNSFYHENRNKQSALNSSEGLTINNVLKPVQLNKG